MAKTEFSLPATGALLNIMLADAAVDPAPVFGSHGEQATPAADAAPPAPPPFRPPAPDWEAEERERLAREREQHAGEEQHESVASLSAQPAKRRKRTPNLDAVRAWREGG